MADVKVYDMKAKEVGSITLNPELFGVEYNEPVIHQVIVAENANARQGTKSTLTVSEVRGHHKKPYAQKHTGNARHGNTKAPQYKGGGIVHAMKPRDFSKKVNKQVKYLAFASALSQKLNQNEITVIDEIAFEQPKTKAMMEMLNAFKFDRKTVIVLDDNNAQVLRAGANIPFLTITTANLLNVGEIVANKNLVFTKSAIQKLEEVRI
ncbi:MAG: 50S ribosomal protein L4 [Clostridia bacterium]|nr:50S ribosomal protein L4 [Clostridia bacterium]MBR2053089.1 50S ribosomal protein L4 [Clostridia bacterium]MBR2221266.1 50S ribosomal protein L4 [Clostridia bacterium]MBR3790318.1 50S ribosomal protein L4 [Clostridia bacterium]